MRELPSLFVSHGAPTVAVEPSPARDFLAGLGRSLPRPRAILCMSAHFETDQPTLTSGAHPATIHDFYGFPEELYRLRYPAPGSPELAEEAARLLREAGLVATLDPEAGFDHGTWVPLLLMFPEADIPVVQLSVQPHRDAAHHARIGRALAPLRRRGVLILGSGALTHNLAEVMARLRAGDGAGGPVAWAEAFARWVEDRIRSGDLEGLCRYRELAPEAVRAHPTEEHLFPLHMAAAAGGGRGVKLHESFAYGSLAMTVYAFPGLAVREAAQEAAKVV